LVFLLFCGRHGKGSKLQALVKADSPPLAIQLESATPHEAKIALALLDLVDNMPDVVVADRAYDLDDLRDEFAERTSKLLAPTAPITRSRRETKRGSDATTSREGG
jgi:hypothetical protein